MDIFKTGDKVRFKNPLSNFEVNAIYEVVNINLGTKRVLITIVNSNLPIPPTELVGIEIIEKI